MGCLRCDDDDAAAWHGAGTAERRADGREEDVISAMTTPTHYRIWVGGAYSPDALPGLRDERFRSYG
jgi:hypothetical protein